MQGERTASNLFLAHLFLPRHLGLEATLPRSKHGDGAGHPIELVAIDRLLCGQAACRLERGCQPSDQQPVPLKGDG
ncbi:MAG: hypothetical protein EBQ53_07920 [Betaproteobacteria bacterium]|nr:hypothetical protein [Betaproteobacteria bacterium]NBY53506.1 hypothetical protein [Betaproteobacteria bacterium]NCU84392.1 hypothetical protein [Betaproteobacteria bacterium]NCU94266.1 hypothetical protein [Betaproteobacteria bacterium]